MMCSRAQLFKFLAAVTAPDAISGIEQVHLAEKIHSVVHYGTN